MFTREVDASHIENQLCIDKAPTTSSSSPFINQLATLLDNLHQYPEVFLELESRFNKFIATYDIPSVNYSLNNHPKAWLCLNKSFSFMALPYPKSLDHQADTTLLLFLFEQLMKYQIIAKGQPCSQSILYCFQYFAEEIILEILQKKQLFIEAFPGLALLHGNLSHLIQFLLIAIAIEQSKLRLDFPLEKLVNKLLITDATGILYWDCALERDSKPERLHMLLLSSYTQKHCPNIGFHILQQYLSQLGQWQKLVDMPLDELLYRALLDIPPSQEHITKYLARQYSNYTTTAYENIYQCTNRSAEFRRVEAAIITNAA